MLARLCPCFTDEERAYYFALTSTETAHMQTFTDGVVQAFFVLQLGYFKNKQRFFSVKLADVLSDLIFIVNQHGLGVAPDDLRLLNPRTLQHQRQIILEYMRYRYVHAHSWTPLNMCWAATAIRRGMIAFSVRV